MARPWQTHEHMYKYHPCTNDPIIINPKLPNMSVQEQSQSSNEVNNDSTYVSLNNDVLICRTSLPESHFALSVGAQLPLLEEKTLEPSSTARSIDVRNDSIIDWILGTVTDANVTPATSSKTPRIPRAPTTVSLSDDFKKYYVPKVVSIGPYYFGCPNLRDLEKRKPNFAMKLLKDNKVTLRRLYEKLGEPEMVTNLRNFYDYESTSLYSAKVFTKMMLLDSCFTLYFINLSYSGGSEKCSELKSDEIFFVRRDLFLLENQIPFKVLKEVIDLINPEWLKYIKPFIDSNCLVTPWKPKRNWLDKLKIGFNFEEHGRNGTHDLDVEETVHLLSAVHVELSKTMNSNWPFDPFKVDTRVNFRNVTELVDVGIHFEPIKGTRSLTHVEFHKDWWGFSAKVKLPPIAVSNYTKPMLLNLMAYEACFSIDKSWVTSYVCLLDSLIDDAEDVKVLRKAWVLENFLSSDKEVAELFNEIATNLVPSSFAYFEAKQKMQAHYQSTTNTLFWQLKNEYFKSPWAVFALLGALIALILTGVQTYFAIWSPKSTCDDLCMFLKMNHHL